jgi:hypothetical protein
VIFPDLARFRIWNLHSNRGTSNPEDVGESPTPCTTFIFVYILQKVSIIWMFYVILVRVDAQRFLKFCCVSLMTVKSVSLEKLRW